MGTRSSDFNYKVALASGLKSLQAGRLRQAEEQFRYLLTRDPRAKERKKPGLKRARKAPQFTKR